MIHNETGSRTFSSGQRRCTMQAITFKEAGRPSIDRRITPANVRILFTQQNIQREPTKPPVRNGKRAWKVGLAVAAVTVAGGGVYHARSARSTPPANASWPDYARYLWKGFHRTGSIAMLPAGLLREGKV
jgi:hypothetical protein